MQTQEEPLKHRVVELRLNRCQIEEEPVVEGDESSFVRVSVPSSKIVSRSPSPPSAGWTRSMQ